MSTIRIEGAVRKAAGAVKVVTGKVTGNDELRVEGAVEKATGSVQNAVGKIQDKLGDALKR